MREADRIECFGRPKAALRRALVTSSVAYTAFVDGEAEAMFGLVVHSALGGEGLPWMLGSEAIYDHPREMLRTVPRFLDMFSDSTPRLSGLVGRTNDRAIRMLRRWGFQIGREVILSTGVEFLSFSRDRG